MSARTDKSASGDFKFAKHALTKPPTIRISNPLLHISSRSIIKSFAMQKKCLYLINLIFNTIFYTLNKDSTYINSMKLIALDLETTGKNHLDDRIVSIGMVEIINNRFLGTTYYQEINPERLVDQESIEVHGLSNEKLVDKPIFQEVAKEILEFIGDNHLVIHNMAFDLAFLNTALEKINLSKIENPTVCTVEMSRSILPISRVSLDAVANYLKIMGRKTHNHNALEDAQLLAKIFIELKNLEAKQNISPLHLKKKRVSSNIRAQNKPLTVKEDRLFEVLFNKKT
jgi:DNA polymerase-3 subunit epsilon